MKRVNNIYDEICNIDNLKLAYKESSRDKHHYKEVKEFEKEPDRLLKELQQSLINQTYSIPESHYTFKVMNDKGKERELMKLRYYPHRIVQWAIMLQIEKYFIQTIPHFSCASMPDKGIDRAYKLITSYLTDKNNTQYCLKIDIKKFYPNIDKEILKNLIRHKFKDKRLLWLLDLIIDSYPKDKGIPIGSYTSQYFANFYLAYFDHWLKQEKKVKYVVRYMDDIVILHYSKEWLHNLKKDMDEYLNNNLKLTIKENYQVFPVESRGIDFIGFVFRHNKIRLRRKNALSLRKIANKAQKNVRIGKDISRHQFCSLNARLGFFQYFNSGGLYKEYVKPLLKSMKFFYYNRVLGKSDKLTLSEKGNRTIKYFRNISMKEYERKRIKPLSHRSSRLVKPFTCNILQESMD